MLATASCVPQAQEAKLRSPGSTYSPAPGTPFRWNSSFLVSGLNVKISEDFRNEFVAGDYDSSGKDPIEQMMHQWNLADSRTYFSLSAETTTNKNYSSLSQYQDGELGIYKSYSWFSDVSSDALAITQFFAIRRNAGSPSEYLELTHADIIVNYRDHDFSLNIFSGIDYDLPSVLIHELGHFIGLQHADYFTNSVMQPYLGMRDAFRSLYPSDISTLGNLYNGASSLTASSGVQGLTKSSSKDEAVSGYFELRANGKCRHYIEHNFVGEHQIVH